MTRDRRGGLDGVLVVAKPAGPTSHDVVALVRRLAATRRVGHGGTLDPFASGVLPVFLGRATRLAEYHLSGRKAYRASVCFGESSTTDDLEGERTPGEWPAPDRSQVEAMLPRFVGELVQRPPAYSAVKVAGRRAYALARAGQTPELAPRHVVVHALRLVGWDDTDPARPIAEIEVECSAGTYIRALARDLGEALHCGAYLGALVRTASGGFTLEDAVPLERIRAAAHDGPDGIRELLLPLDAGLDELPRVAVSAEEASELAEGRAVAPAGRRLQASIAPGGGPVRVAGPDGSLVAIARVHAGRLAPDKVLVDRPDAAPADAASVGA